MRSAAPPEGAALSTAGNPPASTASVFERYDPAAPGFSMSALLGHWAEVQPDTLAIAVGEHAPAKSPPRFTEITFGALHARSQAWARAMRARGLRPGDRAVLFVVDPIDFFALVYACCQLRVVFVLIDPGMGVRSMLRCIEEQAPRALLGVAKAHWLRTLFPRAFRSVEVALQVGDGLAPGASRVSLEAGPRSGEDVDREPAGHRDAGSVESIDAPAAIFYTSGSTGAPKGVVFTHAMMGGQARAIRDLFDFRPGEAHVACFPLFALIAGSLGMSAIVPRMNVAKPAATDPAAIREAFVTYRARSGFGSPALWEPFSRAALRALERGEDATLPEVERLLTAGAPVSPSLHERLLRVLPRGDVFTPYGATEALPISFIGGREVLARTAANTRAGQGTCVGVPVPGVDVRIVAIRDDVIATIDDARELPCGEIGEILVRGPLISRVYDQRDDATRLAKVSDGAGGFFHRMGDVGYLDQDGALWFCGRKAHRVECSAHTLFSVPCEAIAENHPEVARAALAWVGQRPGQVPVMCIELEPLATGRRRARDAQRIISETLALLRAHPHSAAIEQVLIHPRFPVDRRHNAKIERESLAAWAARRVGSVQP